MPIYRPRWLLQLAVPTLGTRQARRAQQDDDTRTFTVVVHPKKFTHTQNDHNHADELTTTVPFKDAGFDIRVLQNAQGTFYLADADEFGLWTPSEKNARFAGIVTKMKRHMADEDLRVIELEFLDYTTLFLEAKPFGSSGIPHLSMRLDEAWRTIVSQTPGAEVLADRLVLQGLLEFPLLSTAVASRFAELAKVATKPKTDAWAVWQQCVGMLGLISYIRVDECIVTTAQNYYTRKAPPRLIFGFNIKEMEETRHPVYRKGIGLTSFDPVSGKTIEALWPPLGTDTTILKKIPRAKTVRTSTTPNPHSRPKHVPTQAEKDAKTRQNEERDYFTFAATTDPKILEDAARRVYEERSRQELQGEVGTSEMRVETTDGSDFDLLSLQSGDDVRIELAQEDKAMLASMLSEGQSEEAMVNYLVDRGYAADVAVVMAANVKELALLDPVFYLKKVVTSADSDDMSYDAKLSYCNRILISGDAPLQTG